MHYANLVLIEAPDEITEESIREAVERMMGAPDDWWDWYEIGGRWTGHFDGYDPETDPANKQPCVTCGGTGKRTDMEVAKGCNGCSGTGISTKWPTQWGFREGDVVPVESLTEKMLEFYRVLSPYGNFPAERYVPWAPNIESKFAKQEMPPLDWIKKEHAGYLAVIVDNHN